MAEIHLVLRAIQNRPAKLLVAFFLILYAIAGVKPKEKET